MADVWRKLQENKRETLCADVYVLHSAVLHHQQAYRRLRGVKLENGYHLWRATKGDLGNLFWGTVVGGMEVKLYGYWEVCSRKRFQFEVLLNGNCWMVLKTEKLDSNFLHFLKVQFNVIPLFMVAFCWIRDSFVADCHRFNVCKNCWAFE